MMVKKQMKRRMFTRYSLNNGAYVLKDSNCIRMGPLSNISLGGVAFCMVPFSENEKDIIEESSLSIRIENLFIENVMFGIVYSIEKEKYCFKDDMNYRVQVGVKFVDLDLGKRQELENVLNNHDVTIIEDRRLLNDRRTGLNRRRCDLPQYRSEFRAGRDRRKEDRRKS